MYAKPDKPKRYSNPWLEKSERWRKLHKVGQMMGELGEALPSVCKDSPQWQAWRTWLRKEGFTTVWSDAQPADRMMTVLPEWPPENDAQIDALIAVYEAKLTDRKREVKEIKDTQFKRKPRQGEADHDD